MLRPLLPGFPVVSGASPGRAILGAVALLTLGASGCRQGLNMASAYDADRPALTIPYTGVKEGLRQYPDYGSIGASILTDDKPPTKGAPKKGSP